MSWKRCIHACITYMCNYIFPLSTIVMCMKLYKYLCCYFEHKCVHTEIRTHGDYFQVIHVRACMVRFLRQVIGRDDSVLKTDIHSWTPKKIPSNWAPQFQLHWCCIVSPLHAACPACSNTIFLDGIFQLIEIHVKAQFCSVVNPTCKSFVYPPLAWNAGRCHKIP